VTLTAATSPAESAARQSPWRHRSARIDHKIAEAPGVTTYGLAVDDPFLPHYRFAAGQFNMLYLPGIGEAAISISSDPQALGCVDHTVRAVGNVTRALARLGVGDTLLLRGPFGTAWPLDALRDRDLVFVGGGLGLASLLSAIRHCLRHRGDYGRITVVHGTKTPADLIAARDHRRWHEHGIDVQGIVTDPDPGWHGPVGLVTAAVERLDIDPPAAAILCCGPEPMMTAVADMLIARGVAADQVFVSIERLMGCAAGLCGLCQLGPLFICRDGPVLAYSQVAPWLRVRHL
jgi:NAD(P)H-flavin reductase